MSAKYQQDIRAERVVFLKAEKYKAERKVSDCRAEIDRQQTVIAFHDAWIKQLEYEICPTCEGHGCLSVWYAHDECKVEPCGTCKGSGVRGTP